MKLQGRKFFGMVLGLLILVGEFVAVLLLAPTALTDVVVVGFLSLQIFLITAYIGGNVFNAYVKSKYFKSELGGRDE